MFVGGIITEISRSPNFYNIPADFVSLQIKTLSVVVTEFWCTQFVPFLAVCSVDPAINTLTCETVDSVNTSTSIIAGLGQTLVDLNLKKSI